MNPWYKESYYDFNTKYQFSSVILCGFLQNFPSKNPDFLHVPRKVGRLACALHDHASIDAWFELAGSLPEVVGSGVANWHIAMPVWPMITITQMPQYPRNHVLWNRGYKLEIPCYGKARR